MTDPSGSISNFRVSTKEEGAVKSKLKPNLRVLGIVVVTFVGAVLGGAGVQYWLATRGVVNAQAPKPGTDLAAEVARLNLLVPSQSHAMSDVGYHWAGLWFAAKEKNWPLAQFFFDEARQHVAWTVAIRPVRDLPSGGTVDISALFRAIDVSAFTVVRQAIDNKNTPQFESAYKSALESCYMCHKAAGKPYLRPTIPSAPPQTIINYDPEAKWPQ